MRIQAFRSEFAVAAESGRQLAHLGRYPTGLIKEQNADHLEDVFSGADSGDVAIVEILRQFGTHARVCPLDAYNISQ